ncbi:hypothetical protein PMAYCL1PPCAC_29402, partial [Pristionchus mayeri]
RFLSSLDRSRLSSSFFSFSFLLFSLSFFFSNSLISNLRLFSSIAFILFLILDSSIVDGPSSNRSSHELFFSDLIGSFLTGWWSLSSFSVIVQSLSP